MRKRSAWRAMIGIVLILAGADWLLLTSSASLSRLAARELAALSDGLLQWDEVIASLDGTVILKNASFRMKAEAEPWLTARRVEIRLEVRLLGGPTGSLERVTVTDVHAVLSDALLEEFSKRGSKTSIRDVFPTVDDLPRILCSGGTVEMRFPAYLAGDRARVSTLDEISLTPLLGYRLRVEGRLRNPVFGAWSAEGELDLDRGAWKAACRTEDWVVGPDLRESLAQEDHRDIYDRFLPSGTCDLTVSMGQVPENPIDFKATLRAKDMGLVYRNFPLKATGVHGEIEFFADRFRIKYTEGFVDHTRIKGKPLSGARVRFDGACGGYPKESPYEFRIEIDDLPLDNELRAALQEDARRVWDSLQPRGTARVRGKAIHERGNEPERIPLEFSLSGASFCYKDFPYAMKGLSGEISVTERDVEIRRLFTREGGVEVGITGRILDITGQSDVDLNIDARGLPLDDRLKKALPDSARKVWDTFSPSGPADVRWNVRQERGKEAVHRGYARARGNSVLYREIPLPVSEIEGEIELEPGRTRLRRVRGKVQGAEVELHGTVSGEGMSLQVDTKGLPIDDAVKAALPRQVGDLLRQMKLSGTANFKSDIKMRENGERKVELDLKLSKGVIDTEPKFEDLLGTMTLVGFFENEPSFMGSLHFSQATVWGKRLTDLSASFNGRGTRINFSYIKAAAYGGMVSSPGFSLDTKTGEFTGAFNVDRMELREYALDTQAFSEKTLSGKVSLELRDLSGVSGDGGSIRGKGKLQVREAVLWDVPVFVSLFTFNPQDLFKSKNPFDAGTLEYDIADRKFRISSLAFTSKSVSLAGKGRVNFDGDMHLRLKVKSGPLFGIDFFITDWVGDFWDFVTGAFVGVDVAGPFDKPVVSAKPLPGF